MTENAAFALGIAPAPARMRRLDVVPAPKAHVPAAIGPK